MRRRPTATSRPDCLHVAADTASFRRRGGSASQRYITLGSAPAARRMSFGHTEKLAESDARADECPRVWANARTHLRRGAGKYGRSGVRVRQKLQTKI